MKKRLLAATAGVLILGAAAARSEEGTAPEKDPNAPIHGGTETVEVTGEGAVVPDAPVRFSPQEHRTH